VSRDAVFAKHVRKPRHARMQAHQHAQLQLHWINDTMLVLELIMRTTSRKMWIVKRSRLSDVASAFFSFFPNCP
jgi:hypothetical protein